MLPALLAKLVTLFLMCLAPNITACSYIYEYFMFANINDVIRMGIYCRVFLRIPSMASLELVVELDIVRGSVEKYW